jgi:hypothetical protein
VKNAAFRQPVAAVENIEHADVLDRSDANCSPVSAT